MGRPRIERVKVTCACCGVEFEKYPADVHRNKTGRFFCSAACRDKVGSKPRQRQEKKCEWCRQSFYPHFEQDARFCGKSCYDAWQRRHRVERVCEYCGKAFDRPPSFETRQKARYCSKVCEAAGRTKRPLDRTHNGRPVHLDAKGYVLLYEPTHPAAYKNGRVLEHRVVVEQRIGRLLKPDEHVHHINGKKDDNRSENLMVLGHIEHLVLSGEEHREAIAKMRQELAEYRERFGPLET